MRARWAGLTGGARYKVGLAALLRACGERVGRDLRLGESSRGWPRRRAVCGAALRAALGSAWPEVSVARSWACLSRRRAQGCCLGPRGCSGWGRGVGMRPLSGTVPSARCVELGLPGPAFLCLRLSRATPFLLLTSRVLSAILPVLGDREGVCVI